MGAGVVAVHDGVPSGLLPYVRWQTALPRLRRQYLPREPFPYAHLVDFFDAKGIIEQIAAKFHLTMEYQRSDEPHLQPGKQASFSLGHIGFMALGAYISAILTLPLDKKHSYLRELPAWLATTHFDLNVGQFPLGFLAAINYLPN